MEIGGLVRGDMEKNFEEEMHDLPPERCEYRDEGCELAVSCLSCPFQRCVYDEPGGKHRLLKGLRDREIVNLFHSANKNTRELAQMFRVSTRTVQRALRGSGYMENQGVISERRIDKDGE